MRPRTDPKEMKVRDLEGFSACEPAHAGLTSATAPAQGDRQSGEKAGISATLFPVRSCDVPIDPLP